MLSISNSKDYRKFGIILIIFITICIVAGFFILLNLNQTQKNTTTHSKQITTDTKPEPEQLTSKILFTGNIFWGRYMNDWSMASPLKYKYPFSGLNTFNRPAYDAWVAGLECPTDPSVNMTSAQMEEALQFNCRPEYLKEASKWFDIVMLSNNHTDNQGPEGFTRTRQQLDKAKMQHFGHYDPREIDDICEVVAMPVTIKYTNSSHKKGQLPIALCGFHGVFRIPEQTAVDQISKYSKYMPVIAMTHMGAEYEASPDEIRTRLYRSMIDAGADMVLGDHPHWIQSTEAYKGKLIVYSMGNFMFDQQFNREVTRSAAIEVKLSTNSNNIDKWLQLGSQCRGFKDKCLEEAEQLKLEKLPVKYQFKAIGSDDSNKLTKKADSKLQDSIEQRLNWKQTMSGLQQ
jgi:hypothetical protein